MQLSGDRHASGCGCPSRARPTRAALIAKGMAYSPAHGDTSFTVPLFDEYMKRVMPEEPDKGALQ